MATPIDNSNPYENLEAITGDSPQDLVSKLKSIGKPFQIVAIVATGNGGKHAAYILGDILVKRSKKNKTPDEGK